MVDGMRTNISWMMLRLVGAAVLCSVFGAFLYLTVGFTFLFMAFAVGGDNWENTSFGPLDAIVRYAVPVVMGGVPVLIGWLFGRSARRWLPGASRLDQNIAIAAAATAIGIGVFAFLAVDVNPFRALAAEGSALKGPAIPAAIASVLVWSCVSITGAIVVSAIARSRRPIIAWITAIVVALAAADLSTMALGWQIAVIRGADLIQAPLWLPAALGLVGFNVVEPSVGQVGETRLDTIVSPAGVLYCAGFLLMGYCLSSSQKWASARTGTRDCPKRTDLTTGVTLTSAG